MKQTILSLLPALLPTLLAAQIRVTGTVTDANGPLPQANVFIEGTIDGCLTDSLGHFVFETQARDTLVLRVSYIGYEEQQLLLTATCHNDLHIRLRTAATPIDEVIVTASTFSFGKTGCMKQLDALDVVMTGNSCGDVVAALQALPGTQRVAEDGRLYVRGGDQSECQTFVNGMHVLAPYTTNAENTAVRGRFSPFLFKGINFSLGGYDGQYGQALSSVLPMETTDMSGSDKLGVSASLVDWNAGGTKALGTAAISFNASLTDLALYEKLMPSRQYWLLPYRNYAAEAQLKKEFGTTTHWKTYMSYDHTRFKLRTDGRPLSLRENSIYVNSVLLTSLGSGYRLMTGVAYSQIDNAIDHALQLGDNYRNRREELHLKAELSRVVSEKVKVNAGVEDYGRWSSKDYRMAMQDSAYRLDYHLTGAHLDAQWRVWRHLFLSTSLRAEHLSTDGRWTWMPRATLNYLPNASLRLSASWGRYSQTADDDYLALGRESMRQSLADHAIVGITYRHGQQHFRVEPYYKRYRRLPRFSDGEWKAIGHGYSRGLDLYNEGSYLGGRLVTTAAYSFCDAERSYLDFPEPSVPRYSTRHNLNLTARYFIAPWRTYLGLAESYASGRPYHNPNKPGYMNAHARAFNEVSMNLTFLIHPKIIVYTSMSNLLGRRNVFGYQNSNNGSVGTPILPSSDHFFYIGVFISIKSNKAYDIANF
ncbi:MAG: TonB-dependent receptor [Bacteroidales bacterium]|nr:TonB-dependent receptor [Bacteroidales bacterium]